MDRKINILHVGDLHMQERDLFEKDVVLEAFLKDVEHLSKGGLKPDLVAFTGDLVQGGDIKSDFELALEHFLMPLCEITGCGPERVFLTQGNHDVQRGVIAKHQHLITGLDGSIIAKDLLDKEINKDETRTYVDDKFENYRELTECLGSSHFIEKTPFYALFFIKELNLSIISINTSWLSTGGEVRDDKEKLAVSDLLLQKAVSKVPEGSKKLLLGHHPVDWFIEHNQKHVLRVIERECDYYLHGHLHEADPKQLTGMNGRVLFNQCGSLYSGSEYFNGYSIISISSITEHVEVNMRTYFSKRQAFDKAVDLCENGQFYPTEEARSYWHSHPGSLNIGSLESWLSNEYRQTLHKEFDFGFYRESLSEVYVEPTISNQPEQLKYNEDVQEEEDENTFFSLADVSASNDNFIINAGREYGKTSLLQKLAIECIEGRKGKALTVPLLINFKELKTGRKQIERSLKQAIHPLDFPSEVTLEQLLKLNMVTVIVDDVNHEDKNKLNKLMEFIEEHSGNRFILCIDSDVHENFGAVWTPDSTINFNMLFLHCFSTNKLRQLVEKWTKTSDKKHNQKILDRMVENILQINVPRTPVIGSIFLAILEQNADFSPINRASMIERFIETLLGKHQPDEARRDTFDYRNKEHYLSHLAGQMVELNKYQFTHSDLIELTANYMTKYALKEDPSRLIDVFIKSRILSDVGNTIKFKYRSVCEYFIAKQMVEDVGFREKILNSDDYLMFQNEIECLSGIKKSDIPLLEAVQKKFFELDEKLSLEPRLETFSELNIRAEGSKNLLAQVDDDLKEGALSEEEKDQMLETHFPQDVGRKQEMYRPIYDDFGHKWIGALTLYSRVLKNTEMMSADQKRAHLFTTLYKWASLAMYSIYAVPTLVERKEIKINGRLYKIVLPANKTDEDLFHHLCLASGLGSLSIAKGTLGTEKLEPIFASELSAGAPQIIELFQGFVLLHMGSSEAVGQIKKIIPKIKDANYLLELTLVELNHFLKVRPLTKDEEKEVLSILELTAKNLRKGLDKPSEQYAGVKYREKVKKQLLIGKQKKTASK